MGSDAIVAAVALEAGTGVEVEVSGVDAGTLEARTEVEVTVAADAVLE